jgi:predicted MFS family arabinose efflux permease
MQDELADKASTLVNVAYSLSYTVAMITGGFLTEKFGFRACCDMMAFVAACVTVLNFSAVQMNKVMHKKETE